MNKRHYEHTLPNIRGSLSNTYKQLAARLKARDRLHSKVVAPESGKTGTKNGKMNAVIYRSAFKKWALLKT